MNSRGDRMSGFALTFEPKVTLRRSRPSSTCYIRSLIIFSKAGLSSVRWESGAVAFFSK